MEKFLEKIEEYNVLNYLLPGIVFSYLLKSYVGINIIQESTLEMGFIYYFIGSIISRVGSVCLKEILEKINYMKFSTYTEYINSTKEDEVIEKLSLINNMYRTLCTTFIILLIFKVLKITLDYLNFQYSCIYTIFIILAIWLYLLSYKKQTQFIIDRIERIKNKKD